MELILGLEPLSQYDAAATPAYNAFSLVPNLAPYAAVAPKIAEAIGAAKTAGDSLGGLITVIISGAPVGLGEPVFGKLKARLADAFAGVGAVTGVLWGPPELASRLELPGSAFHALSDDGLPSEVYGGIQGGMSTGAPISMRVMLKPPSTLGAHATTGRHDPCILPRAVPVIEAMVSLVLADAWLHLRAREHRA